MLSIEREPVVINKWAVYVEPDLPTSDRSAYLDIVQRLANLPLQSRFALMARMKMACIMIVDVWKNFETIFDNCVFSSEWLLFNTSIGDTLGYEETGQNALMVKIPNSEGLLLMDVAGYLFGFSYEHIPIVIGKPKFIEETMTHVYSKMHPGVSVSLHSLLVNNLL